MHSFWYLLAEDAPRPGAHNMAADQHILSLIEDGTLDVPVLRIYAWSKPTLSLGYHQQWQETVQKESLKELNIDLVRRWTGGRAVLHDHEEITYSVIAPMTAPFSRKISHNYTLIGKALAFFSDLGAGRSKMTETEESVDEVKKMRHAPCFASLAKSEIEGGGRKMIGSAQKLGKSGFLQHGSIPLIHRPDVLEAITGTRLDMSRLMTSLDEHYQEVGLELPSRNDLVQRLIAGFEQAFDIKFKTLAEAGFPDQKAIETIAQQRFSRDDWTFRK